MENTKFCCICKEEYLPFSGDKYYLSKPKKFIKDDYEDFSDIVIYDEDNPPPPPEPHLDCRIKCANYSVAGIPDRWIQAGNLIVTDGNKEAIERIRKHNIQSQGLYLYGKSGTGKTFLLSQIAKTLIDNNCDVIWKNVPNLLAEVKNSFGKSYGHEDDETIPDRIFRETTTAKYLFLDDIGAESGSDWNKETLYGIINTRYDNNLTVCLSSNITPVELCKKFEDRFASRIIEMCLPIRIDGEDARLNKEIREKNDNFVIPPYCWGLAKNK